MNANDIIEKCASIAESEPVCLDSVALRPQLRIAKAIRALKSSSPAETVSEAMVERAAKAYVNSDEYGFGHVSRMRAALEAACVPSQVTNSNAQETRRIAHVANEWADMATNGLQWLKNIRDGISTPPEAIANMEDNLKHCYDVRDAAILALADEGWRPIARDALRELAFAPVPDTIPDLVCDALRYADRVSVLLNDLSREVLALTVDDNDHRFDKLHDLLRRRFFDCSGMHLFIAADKLKLALPSDLRGDDDTLPAPPKDGRE